MISYSNSLSRESGMPIQVNGALLRAPCPVQSCPACEPNTGSVHPNLPAKAARVERGPTLLCNQVGTSTHLSDNPTNQELSRAARHLRRDNTDGRNFPETQWVPEKPCANTFK